MKCIKISWFLLFPLLLSIGCKTKQNVTQGELRKRSSSYLFAKNEKYHLDTEWFDAKANVQFTQGNSRNTATAHIRMKKDSAIWASVKKFGFEGARLLVTPDSVFFINRLNKTYIAEKFSYIQTRTGLKGTGDATKDFNQLYDLILGNVVMRLGGKYKANIEIPHYVLTKDDGELKTTYWLEGRNYLLKKQSFQQDAESKRASCLYDNYQTIDKQQLFSYFRVFDIYSNSTGKMNVELKFSKVTLHQPVKMRFSIPKRYDRTK